MIPDEAVEAASAALVDATGVGLEPDTYKVEARAVLDAALPYLTCDHELIRCAFLNDPLGPPEQEEGPQNYAERYGCNGCDSLSARVRELEAALAECYRLTGSDPDGATDAMLANHAVEAVRQLREDYDGGA